MDNNQKDRIMNKFIYLLACTLFVSCQNNNKSSVTKMEVELDSMWCTRLMPGLGGGVTGGDGAISIGTTGIVEPMSDEGWKKSFYVGRLIFWRCC